MFSFFFQVLLTPRNIFIANLAISDLFLCTFTMPLTLVELLYTHWSWGRHLVRIITSQGNSSNNIPVLGNIL